MIKCVNVHLTDDCNFDCEICFENKGEVPKYLDKDTLLAFLVDYGAGHVGFVGGEPLCHPKINEIIQQLKLNNIHTCLVTNGELLDRLKILPNRLSIGVDNDDQTKVDAFLATKPECAIEITITPTDIEKADALIEKYKDYTINISMLAFWDRNPKAKDYITPAYISWVKQKISQGIKVFGESVAVDDFYSEVTDKEYQCVAPLNIFSDGHIEWCDLEKFPTGQTIESYNVNALIKNWTYSSSCKDCNLRRKI